MTQEITERDKLRSMMEEARKVETDAIAEAAEYLNSTEALAFRNKIEAFQKYTVPGSHADNVFGSLIAVFDSSKDLTVSIVDLRKRQAEQKGN